MNWNWYSFIKNCYRYYSTTKKHITITSISSRDFFFILKLNFSYNTPEFDRTLNCIIIMKTRQIYRQNIKKIWNRIKVIYVCKQRLTMYPCFWHVSSSTQFTIISCIRNIFIQTFFNVNQVVQLFMSNMNKKVKNNFVFFTTFN